MRALAPENDCPGRHMRLPPGGCAHGHQKSGNWMSSARRAAQIDYVGSLDVGDTRVKNAGTALRGHGAAVDSSGAPSPGLADPVEEICGWMKTVGFMRKTRHRGRERVGRMFVFTVAVYDLIRIRNLIGAGG